MMKDGKISAKAVIIGAIVHLAIIAFIVAFFTLRHSPMLSSGDGSEPVGTWLLAVAPDDFGLVFHEDGTGFELEPYERDHFTWRVISPDVLEFDWLHGGTRQTRFTIVAGILTLWEFESDRVGVFIRIR